MESLLCLAHAPRATNTFALLIPNKPARILTDLRGSPGCGGGFQ